MPSKIWNPSGLGNLRDCSKTLVLTAMKLKRPFVSERSNDANDESGEAYDTVRRERRSGETMRLLLLKIVALALLVASLVTAFVEVRDVRSTTADKNEIERGRYLVEEVAKCTECHTPRNAQGELDHSAWLQGAPIWIMPVRPIPNWADNAPPLAGFPSFTEEEGERILEKGIGPEGEVLRPPMHIYHMNHADAKAIIAYLKSLPRPRH